MRAGQRVVAAILLTIGLASCGGGAKPAAIGGSSAGVALTGAGATFPYPIYSKWFDEYRQKTGVVINYQSIGSGAGIQQMTAGTVDFGASDAPLSDEKLAQMPRPVVHIATVGGAVVLGYNLPELKSPLRLTPDLVAGIFLGTVKSWNDPKIAAANPGAPLPTTAILPVYRSDGSGTTNVFTTYLAAVSPTWKTKVGVNTSVSWPGGVGAKGNDGVTGVIRQSAGAIGYVELAYARQNNIPTALLKNRSGKFVEPSLASTTTAIDASSTALTADIRTPIVNATGDASYPISALTFLLVYKDQKDPAKGESPGRFHALGDSRRPVVRGFAGLREAARCGGEGGRASAREAHGGGAADCRAAGSAQAGRRAER